jgi:hypothetical protein
MLNADWERAMLHDLGAEEAGATRKLMQNLVTCTAQTKLTQLVRPDAAALLMFTATLSDYI